MTIKASGRSALIFAAGFVLCVAGPMRATDSLAQAAEGGTSAAAAAPAATPDKPIVLKKFTRQRSARKASRSSKSDRLAIKAAGKESDKTAAKDASESSKNAAAEAGKDTARDAAPAMPEAVANANAQWPGAGDAPQTFAANVERPATPDLVAADQLNELDRAATESPPGDGKPALTLASATLEPHAAVVSSDTSSTLDKTSLIGKIFIAFGGLLTLASAARMFIA